MPTYYVQRTVVQIFVQDGETPEEALNEAIDANAWDRSIDTEIEYAVLDASGKAVG
tara:strand:+ start:227 stop:394 length:168 start_codon:yes stop_codon:yes gene_type:complete